MVFGLRANAGPELFPCPWFKAYHSSICLRARTGRANFFPPSQQSRRTKSKELEFPLYFDDEDKEAHEDENKMRAT